MWPPMRRALFAGILAVVSLSTAVRTADPPKLIVLVVADQMRADHLATFKHRWKSGFRVLIEQGAYFPTAEYPYLNTVTCAGHTTIATGAYPHTHGVVLNGW